MPIEVVELDAASEDKNNARKHGDANRKAIAASLREYGAGRSIVLDGANVVRAGNGTLEAAKANGVKRLVIVDGDRDTLVAVRRNDWTEQQAAGYAITDNRSGELATWENEQLHETLATLDVEDAELADVLAKLNADTGGELPEVELESPTPKTDAAAKKWKVKKGQLWEIKGKQTHRLLCGDSTKPDDLAKLLGKEKADALITDPPYGVAYQTSHKTAQRIEGDLTEAVIPIAFACAVDHALDKNARLYLFGGSGNYAMYLKLWDYYLKREPSVIVWGKEQFVLRNLAYHSQFELVYWGWLGAGGGKKYWFGDRKQSDLWEVARGRETEHGNEKPIEVFARPMRNSVAPGGLVLDTFGGSGSSMVAAEQTGRRGYVNELSPRYCAVILERMETLGCECSELKG